MDPERSKTGRESRVWVMIDPTKWLSMALFVHKLEVNRQEGSQDQRGEEFM